MWGPISWASWNAKTKSEQRGQDQPGLGGWPIAHAASKRPVTSGMASPRSSRSASTSRASAPAFASASSRVAPYVEHAGEGDHLGDPTAVRLALQLDHELAGGHGRRVPVSWPLITAADGVRFGGSYRATRTTLHTDSTSAHRALLTQRRWRRDTRDRKST